VLDGQDRIRPNRRRVGQAALDVGAPVARPGQPLILGAASLVGVAGFPLALDVQAEPGDVAHRLDLGDAQHRVPGHRCSLPGGRSFYGNARFRMAHHRPLWAYSQGWRRERNILRAPRARQNVE